MSISEAARRKLIQKGIPGDRHDAASLAALFPPEFKVSDARLSAAELADVYLTFLEHGLLHPREHQALPRLGANNHVCHFYRSEEESILLSVAYLEEGLRGGERCLWVMPAWLTKDRARDAMREGRPALDEAESAGRISFYDDHDVHVDRAGRMRDARGIIEFWLEQEQLSLSQSFRGLRIAGDGTALITQDDWRPGVEYEHSCDEAFHGRKISALCSYGVSGVPVQRLAEVLQGHAVGVARAEGGWASLRPGAGLTEALEQLRAG